MQTRYIKICLIGLFVSSFGFVSGQEQHLSPDCSSPWKLNLQVSPLLTQLTSDTYNSEEKGKTGFNGSISLGYYFKNTGKLKMGASVGVGYSVYNAKRLLNYNDSVWTNDAGGDQVHVFEQGAVAEKQNISFLTVPLQLHFDYALTGKLSFYSSAGYYFSFNTSGKYTSDAVLSRQGYYPHLNALIYDVDVEGSNYFYPENKPMSDKGTLRLRNSGSIMVSFGAKYAFTPKVSLYGGIRTSFGLDNISDYSSGNGMILTGDYSNLNSLMSRGDKIKAIAYGLEIGISLNIGRCKSKSAEKVQDIPVPVSEAPVEKVDTTSVIAAEDTLSKPTPTVADTTIAETIQDTIKPSPSIAGKDDITKVPEPIELAFTNDSNKVVNPPVNYNPRRVYTLEEVNSLIEQGVSIQKKYTVLQRIEFVFNTDKLTPQSEKYLDQLVEFMLKQQASSVKIIGHTDNVGGKAFNQTLSEKRAASVKAYLESKGVSKERLSSTGFGMDKPIDTNDTSEGRTKNRRVEFVISWK